MTLLGLLVATAAAFAVTEHLKLIKSPVYGAHVSELVSPACSCAGNKATISVRLRHPDRVTVTIEDSGRHPVATLAVRRHEPAKQPVRFVWDGRTDAGGVAPDGSYRPEVHLAAAHRTILLPNEIVVDTKAPQVLAASVAGDGALTPGARRTIAIHYSLSERAHAIVYLAGRRIIRGRPSRPRFHLKWGGTRDGRDLPAGRYVLSVGAVDLAGNTTPASGRKDVLVRIRYVTLSPHVVRARAGSRFSVQVETGAPRYTWRLGNRHGSGRGSVLRLQAPGRRGTFGLVVAEHGHRAVARVSVRPK